MMHQVYHKYFLFTAIALIGFGISGQSKDGSSRYLSAGGCSFISKDTARPELPQLLHLDVHLDEVKQTMHSFGASDCWTTKFIGQWADEKKKNKIADLLFSMDTLADGSPVGIGLSLWRFNIGAGSYEQGDSSGIRTDWRREECFLDVNGAYDWSKQAGQQWFLRAARKRGVRYTLGFAISPPVFMTKNGKAFSSGGTHFNIQPGKLSAYADFLATVAAHFHFDYISPFNEPQWSWAGDKQGLSSQEGSPATDEDIVALVRSLSEKLSHSAAAAQVVVGEAGQWDFLYGRNNDHCGDQIRQFFSASSPDHIGSLPHVAKIISSHSYFTTCPDDKLIGVRKKVADKIRSVDPAVQTWQSEFGVLGDICGQYNGAPRHTGMDYGLYVARVIHHDLTVADVTSWQWWLAVNPYDYSDGLVYINAPDGKINVDRCKEDGIVETSRQLWVLGNYARFVRPGMQRIVANVEEISDPLEAAGSIMVSAYKDAAHKRLVIVLINMSSQAAVLTLKEASLHLKGNVLDMFTTDASHDLKRSLTHADHIVAGARSVITLTGSYR